MPSSMHRVLAVLLVVQLAEISFRVGVDGVAWNQNNGPWNVNLSPDPSDPAAYYGKWEGHSYFPSPEDWRDHPVYQFITDRWADGRPENNEGRYGGYDLYRVDTRHGGDFLGAAAKLDYIKSLGYTAIWISPVFQNLENSYHGYSQIDFTLLDDRFGTLDDLRTLTTEAHKRGMYVIVDIVVNHMSNLFYFEGHKGQSTPFHMHTDEYRLFPFDPNTVYSDFWVNNTYYSYGTYGQVYNDQGWPVDDNFGQGSFWESDFHHNGDLLDYSNPWNDHLGKIYGIMDDLRNEHPRVQDKILAMHKALILSADIDGIRMDTPMQVPLSFFKRWATDLRSFASSIGKSNFLFFAEFYCASTRAATMTGRGKTPAMYGKSDEFIDGRYAHDGGINYPAYFWFQNAIRNQNNDLGGLKDVLDNDLYSFDFWMPSKEINAYRHLIFFDNHDQVRLSSAKDGFRKTDLSSSIIAFWPGIPLFYYGDDQGFLTYGTALDGWSREDFMTSLAWRKLPTVDGQNPANFDNFNFTQQHFLWVQQINNIRRHYPNLRTCDTIYERWRQANNQNGIYAYTRACGDASTWLLVLWNTWLSGLQAGGNLGHFYTGWQQGDVIVNLLNEAENYTLGPGGEILGGIQLDGYATKIFALQRSVQLLDPAIYFAYPAHDSIVAESDIVVSIAFSQQMAPNSVISAFRFDGQQVDPSLLAYDPTENVLYFKANNIADGIHYMTVLDSAQTADGQRTLFGTFNSRFLHGQANNILLYPTSSNATFDPNLITGIVNNQYALSHKATGAAKLRVTNGDGHSGTKWGSWQPYAETTYWPVTSGVRTITVQYWADFSAAYYVSTNVTAQF